MKKPILFFALLFLLTSFSHYSSKQRLSEPDRIQGMYIFTDALPVDDYKTLGNSKIRVAMTGAYAEIRNRLIKKTQKDYPKAEGIIIRPERGTGEAIVFKD